MAKDKFVELLNPITEAFSRMLTAVAPMAKMENLDDILEADFTSIRNEKARHAVEQVYSMSIQAGKATYELHSVYTDALLCLKMARRFPWRRGTFKKSEHLNFVWMLFVNLCYLFKLKLKRAYNVTRPLARWSKGGVRFDVANELKILDREIGRHVRARGEHWHQWNVGHKWVKDYRMFEFLDEAGKMPEGFPPIESLFKVTQHELVADVESAVAAMDASLERFVNIAIEDIAGGMNFFVELLNKLTALEQAAE